MRSLLAALALCVVTVALPAVAQEQLTVEQRIGIEVGPIIVNSALRAAQIEALKAQVADLKKQLEEAKAAANGGAEGKK